MGKLFVISGSSGVGKGTVIKEFLNKKEKERLTEYADFDLPRSFILCKNKDNGYKVVFSRISTVGLKDRAEEYKTEE